MNRRGAQLDLFREGAVGPAAVTERLRGRAAALPRSVYLGTSSWSFPGWAGLVYDRRASRSTLAREGLAAYARHPLLRAVGLDRTYYDPLPAEALRRYAAAVPEGFRFVVKAHELCTVARFGAGGRHAARAGEPNPHFLDTRYALRHVIDPLRQGLGDAAGPIVFQFPPRQAVDPADFAERLHDFLAALPRGALYAFEIRDRRWLTPRYADALEAGGGLPCLSVHPTMPDVSRQIGALGGATRWPALVVRWNLGGSQRYEAARDRYAPFDRIVDPDPGTLAAIADLCAEAARAGRPAFVTVNNKAEGSAPRSVARLARLTVERLATSYPAERR